MDGNITGIAMALMSRPISRPAHHRSNRNSLCSLMSILVLFSKFEPCTNPSTYNIHVILQCFGRYFQSRYAGNRLILLVCFCNIQSLSRMASGDVVYLLKFPLWVFSTTKMKQIYSIDVWYTASNK